MGDTDTALADLLRTTASGGADWTALRARSTKVAALFRRVEEADGFAPFGRTEQARRSAFAVVRDDMLRLGLTDGEVCDIVADMIAAVRAA